MTIGLKRGTVKLSEHNLLWKEEFEKEKRLLTDKIGDKIINIEHIGSTSIPGIKAKPIIDILMTVNSLDVVKEIQSILENMSYEYRENASDSEHVFFAKGPEEKRTHYLHITAVESSRVKNDLLFRDFLISHPDAAKEYNDLKESLANKYFDNRQEYTKAKESFICSVLDKARKEN